MKKIFVEFKYGEDSVAIDINSITAMRAALTNGTFIYTAGNMIIVDESYKQVKEKLETAAKLWLN